ncbi:ROK family transcriptional regulator [Agromyces humatus]|uniref:ROK family transcriptional regulator n=1 Tax=Agromyces humatus TaxID=279573 RepID=A0ABN2KZ09_9MICO|nr:ROK family transcriptional regulator [Agromyces humatus]
MMERQVYVSDSGRELAREVLIHGPISRAELGRRLGLSPASLTRLSKPFLDRGWFIEAAETVQGATGRPAKPLDVQVDSRRFVGVKVTGESAFGVITDLRAGALGQGERSLAGHDVDAVVEAVSDLVAGLRDGDGVEVSGLGVSIGGNVADQRVVTRAPFLGWRNIALADRLERELGIPVTVENDVTALTTAEQWFGAVRGRPAFAVVTIGAGVGYGLVMHDRVVTTADSGLGLGGHLPLDPNGPLCLDGHRGCSTAMLAIPSITLQLGIALGREVDYDEVLRLAESGHPLAVSVTSAAGRALGRMMATIANIAMVDTIVLSGEGVALWNAIGDLALATLAEDRDPDATPVEINVDDAGFVSWARGAAAVAIQAALGRLRLPA